MSRGIFSRSISNVDEVADVGGAVQEGTRGAEEGRGGTFQPATSRCTAGDERGQSRGKLGKAFPGEQGRVRGSQTAKARMRLGTMFGERTKRGVDELSASNGAPSSMAGAGAVRG
jgi:hypothetical protein